MRSEMYQEQPSLTTEQEQALDEWLDSLPVPTDEEREQEWAEMLAELSTSIDSFLAIRDRLRQGPSEEDQQALLETKQQVVELIKTVTEVAA